MACGDRSAKLSVHDWGAANASVRYVYQRKYLVGAQLSWGSAQLRLCAVEREKRSERAPWPVKPLEWFVGGD